MRQNRKQSSEVQSSSVIAGHQMYCVTKCRKFTVHRFEMIGNGTPVLSMRCLKCGGRQTFKFVVGQWVPESVMETLGNFTERLIKKATILVKATEAIDRASEEADLEDAAAESLLEDLNGF